MTLPRPLPGPDAVPQAVPTGRAGTAAVAALGGALVLALLLPPLPPLQDFPEWAYQGALLARALAGEDLPPGMTLAPYPVPNGVAPALLALLGLVLPGIVAALVFATALVGASVWVALRLGARWQPAAPAATAAILLVSVYAGAGFWNGYVSYQLGLVLLGAFLLLPDDTRRRALPIAGFGVAIILTHAMAFAAFAALVGAEALLARRLRPALLGLAPAVLLAAWYAAAAAGANATAARPWEGARAFLLYKAYTLAKLGPYHNFVFAGGGDAVLRPGFYRIGAGLNVLYAAGLAPALAAGAWGGWRRRRVAGGLVLAALGLGTLGLALPDLVQNVVNPGERLLVPAVLLLLLALPVPPRALRALAAGGLVLAASLLTLAGPGPDWTRPLHYTDLVGPSTSGLFRHRPTAFTCKWAELRRLDAEGGPPRQPIAFATGLILAPVRDGCAMP